MRKIRIVCSLLFVLFLSRTSVIDAFAGGDGGGGLGDECSIERLTASDFAYPQIEGVSDMPYMPGERLEITYYIRPSSESVVKKLDGNCGVSRYYDVYTTLEQSEITATVTYISGTEMVRPISDDIYEPFGNGIHLSFGIPDTGSEDGIEEIKVKVMGLLPSLHSDKVTILRFDISHADKKVLPPVQLVASSNNVRTPVETPTPQPTSKIENLSISIYPDYVVANPGDIINYTVTIDWYPPDWRGDVKFYGVISAAGFEKSFELQPTVKPSHNPPIKNEIPIPLPQNIPPFTYKLKLTIEAGSLRASNKTEVKIKATTPGFEAIDVFMTVLTSLALMSLRKFQKN